MNKYTVRVTIIVTTTTEVEANDEEKAVARADEKTAGESLNQWTEVGKEIQVLRVEPAGNKKFRSSLSRMDELSTK